MLARVKTKRRAARRSNKPMGINHCAPRLWPWCWRQVETGERLHKLKDHKGCTLCLEFSACGRFLATGGQDALVLV